jgi:hypothetical protein
MSVTRIVDVNWMARLDNSSKVAKTGSMNFLIIQPLTGPLAITVYRSGQQSARGDELDRMIDILAKYLSSTLPFSIATLASIQDAIVA